MKEQDRGEDREMQKDQTALTSAADLMRAEAERLLKGITPDERTACAGVVVYPCGASGHISTPDRCGDHGEPYNRWCSLCLAAKVRDLLESHQALIDALKAVQSQCAGHSDEFSLRVWQIADAALAEGQETNGSDKD